MTVSNKILSDITIFNKYAKYIPELNRRESWEEICSRYMNMMIDKYPSLELEIINNMQYIRTMKILPSMRAMQFAGKPIQRNNARLYNCSFLPINDYRAFNESCFLLLSGCGIGYSVQKHHVEQLPTVNKPKHNKKYLISDDIEGWSNSIKALCKAYFGFTDYKPKFDFSDIRPKGTRLKTSGGKAPGHVPLMIALSKIEAVFENIKEGDRLKPIDCHQIMCHIADCVLSGGIRRSAMIALFSKDDTEMIECKNGSWWELHPEFGRSNNSVVLERNNTTKEQFLNIWKKIEMSGSGEPGYYWTNNKDWGTNPSMAA